MKFNTPTLVTFTAPTCSGKSFILDHFAKEDTLVTQIMRVKKPDWKFTPIMTRVVSTTTRPMRKGERDSVDYYFISMEQSLQMEKEGLFAELVDFRGVRYGVTHEEMAWKMNGDLPPGVILEPLGLSMYEKYVKEHGWDIFKVFVDTPEAVRIHRLSERTALDIRNGILDLLQNVTDIGLLDRADMLTIAEKQLAIHSDRMLSITGDERNWKNANTWDAIVPGDDIHDAIAILEAAIDKRNQERG